MNQKFSIQDLEPADVDPKKLRLFAIKLFTLAMACAVVIIYSYKKNTQRQDDVNRPPRVHPIKNKLQVSTLNDDEVAMTAIVTGKISLVVPVCVDQPQDAKVTLSSVEAICLELNTEARALTQIVLMSVNPEIDSPATMQKWINQDYDFSGVSVVLVDGPSATQEEAEDTRHFAKKQFRFEPLYNDKNTKKWIFPTMVALVDTKKTFRGRYDFEEAYQAAPEYGKILESKLISHINYLVTDSKKAN